MRILWFSPLNISVEPIIGSLDSINHGEHEIRMLYYNQIHPRRIGHEMISAAIDFKPDVMLYISTNGGPFLPATMAFTQLKQIGKIIHICFDASCPDWHPLLEEYKKEECFTKTVNIDGGIEWPQSRGDITLLAPLDPRPYNLSKMPSFEEWNKRPVLCGFQGGTSSKDRDELIGVLQRKGLITVNTRNEERGTYQDYANFMKSCKCVLNMSLCGSGKSGQVKARVKETGLAGACLLEQRPSATEQWFLAGEEYHWFETKDQAIRLITALKENIVSAYLRATILHERVRTEHSPERFWEKVIGE